MKLDHDYVRAVLLAIEENDSAIRSFQLMTLMNSNVLEGFDKKQVFYTLKVLEDAGFVEGEPHLMGRENFDFTIKEMTWQGHRLLDNIRDASIWSEVQERAAAFESVSMDVLAETAASLLATRLQK